jgi:hypothetical protein
VHSIWSVHPLSASCSGTLEMWNKSAVDQYKYELFFYDTGIGITEEVILHTIVSVHTNTGHINMIVRQLFIYLFQKTEQDKGFIFLCRYVS